MKFVKFGDPAPGTEAPQHPAINLTQKAWSALILTRYGVAMRMRAAIFQSVALASGLTMALSGTGQAQQLKVCKSTFALCTIAPCDPIPGNDNQVSCHCLSIRVIPPAQSRARVLSRQQKVSRSTRATIQSRVTRSAQMTGPGHGAWISPASSTRTILKRLRAHVT